MPGRSVHEDADDLMATGPIHEGMLQAAPSRAVRYDDRPAQPEGPPAAGGGD